MKKNKNLELSETGYTITTDPNFLNKQNHITPELSKKIGLFHKLALEGKRSSIQKFKEAIAKYPDNPQLKNYLSVLYLQLGETEKMFEVNRSIVEEHPDYLFGKLNLANEYYSKKEYQKMLEILGPKLEIKALYPHRDVFHLNEVISFHKCAVLYLCAIGDVEQAEIRYEIMEALDPDSNETEMALKELYYAQIKAGSERYQEERKNKIFVNKKSQPVSENRNPPCFSHQEIEWLYTNGIFIGEDKINKILALPRETLIADLELILQDSINRFAHFNKLVSDQGWEEEKMNFVIHSFFLLGELKSEESLEAIFNALSQSSEYLELYIGDFLTTDIWEPIYKIAATNLEACKQFMFQPGIDDYARSNICDIVQQLALHHPEKREEALQWFAEIIQFFLNSKPEDNVISSDVVGLLICNIIDIEGVELLPEVEKLFEQGIVSIGICGSWENVSEDLINPIQHDCKLEILPIVQRYAEVTSTWAGYNEDENILDYINYDELFEPQIMPVRSEPKIGRNDPCPCGSGKKYKKCCMNN
tara:strand:+ start:307 stop:1905 length:1599 start_codon:yes stop_codon:yes gene_type:complete